MNLTRLAAAPVLLVAGAVAAQQPAPASVAGSVYDSVAHAPLRGAGVQLVRADSTAGEPHAFNATTDADGRFQIPELPPGAYLVGFFHPALDSLGLEAPAHRIDVRAGRATRVQLAMPAGISIRRALCPADQPGDSSALILGFARDASTRLPRTGTVVRVAWSDFILDRAGARREDRNVDATTLENGWFAACGVPMAATVSMRGTSGADTSGIIDVDVGAQRLVRRDVYIGHADVAGGSVASLRGTVHTGDGHSLAGARIGIVGHTASAVTGENGVFTLAQAPAGSQTLDVRAVGYLPVRRSVDLIGGDVPNVTDLSLVSVRAYLDTVRVTSQRIYSVDRTGFERRKRTSGIGFFLDRNAIDRRGGARTSELLRMIPGVRINSGMGGDRISMRAMAFGYCTPEIYLDGMLISLPNSDGSDPTAGDEINLVQPQDLEGIEVYRSSAGAPPQYSRSMSGCGSVLLWTRPPEPKIRRR